MAGATSAVEPAQPNVASPTRSVKCGRRHALSGTYLRPTCRRSGKGGRRGLTLCQHPLRPTSVEWPGGANHNGLVRRAQSLSSCRKCISAVESERMKTLVIPFSAGRPPCVRLNVPNPSSGQKNVEFVGSIRLATTFFKRYQSSARSPVRSSTPDCRAPRSADRPDRAGQQWPTSRRTLANR